MLRIRSIIAVMVQWLRLYILKKRGYDIGANTIIERNIMLDKVYPKGIHIGSGCLIASGVTILTHDHCKRTGTSLLDCYMTETYIGDRCFLAVGSIVMYGVKIGDDCIVGAGAVVTKDVPSGCIVAGNPARIIRKGIKMTNRAELVNWNPADGFIGTEKV